jgi:hypothetical protein
MRREFHRRARKRVGVAGGGAGAAAGSAGSRQHQSTKRHSAWLTAEAASTHSKCGSFSARSRSGPSPDDIRGSCCCRWILPA